MLLSGLKLMAGIRLTWKEITVNLSIQQSEAVLLLRDIPAKKSLQVP